MLKQMTIEPTEESVLYWIYGKHPVCCPIKADAARQLGVPINRITVSAQVLGFTDEYGLPRERARLSTEALAFVRRVDGLPPAQIPPAEVMAELLRPFPAFNPEDVDAV